MASVLITNIQYVGICRQREGVGHIFQYSDPLYDCREPAKAEPCTGLYDRCRTSRRNHSSNLYARQVYNQILARLYYRVEINIKEVVPAPILDPPSTLQLKAKICLPLIEDKYRTEASYLLFYHDIS